ncbi:MAG TPA: pepsin/retropepsin-like aspartic protease family protein [Allosphingosinicella sp.]|nr:pepsin/retropepsin-like aspartic protease family protein [Allosphingosinicella sp.]
MRRAALLIAAALLPSATARAAPVELFNNRPFLSVTVDGRPVTALLDSAAEMTVIDDDAAARLGLTQSGSATAHGSGAAAMEARFADHVAVEAAGVSLELRAGVLDLGEVSARLLGRPVEMLLGRDLFDNARLRLDLAGGTLTVAEGEPRGVRLPLGDHRGTPTIPAAVEGHDPVDTVLDTGNGSEVLIGRAYAERIGLTAPGRVLERREGGGLGGARSRDIVMLRTLVVAGRTFTNVRAAIDPGETASDLNIGTSILRHFILTTDFAGRQVWLEPRP